jgi:transposase
MEKITQGWMQMSRTQAMAHVSVEEGKKRMDESERLLSRKRWRLVSHALVAPSTAESIALHCGVSIHGVHTLISRENRYGLAARETTGKGGRRREHLSLEQERQLLESCVEHAKQGEGVVLADIHHASETAVGHAVAERTVSRLLKRHGWRKLTPRPRHPKASKHGQEAFKKTVRPLWLTPSQPSWRETPVLR